MVRLYMLVFPSPCRNGNLDILLVGGRSRTNLLKESHAAPESQVADHRNGSREKGRPDTQIRHNKMRKAKASLTCDDSNSKTRVRKNIGT